MKMWIFILSATILTGCANSSQVEQAIKGKRDSIHAELYNELLSMRTQLDTMTTMSSLYLIDRDKKRNSIDSLMQKLIEYKDNAVEVQLIRKKILQISSNNRLFFKRIEELNRENEKLKSDNLSVTSELQEEKNSNQQIVIEKKKLETKINEGSKLAIGGVKITPIGFTKPLFGKPKPFETYEAKKVKQVDITFFIAPNKIAKKGKRTIITLIYSNPKERNISEQLPVDYDGSELKVSMSIGKSIEYKVGGHPIEIFIDDYMVYNGNLELK